MTTGDDQKAQSGTRTVAGGGKESGVPLCFVLDEDSSVCHYLSLILHGAGVDTQEFAEGPAMLLALARHRPDVIFLNVSLESSEAIQTILALYKQGYFGFLQLMSNRGGAVLEHVKSVGDEHRLQMLPILKKPFDASTITAIMQSLKLGDPAPTAARVDLGEALSSNWVEFWFQPKIDLRKKTAESFARVRDPKFGIVPPAAFMPGATDDEVLKLSELALTSALSIGTTFAKIGINLPVAFNLTIENLAKLPMADIVRAHHGPADAWPGLIIDIPEDEIISDLARATDLADRFASLNVKLAIDNFGRNHVKLARLRKLPFAEFKLDRTFVTDCVNDKVNAPLCKTIIDLAHHFESLAVANGIEKSADALALTSMGCDLGQGYLFGKPMPAERFVALLRQRALGQNRPVAAPAAAATAAH